MDILVAPRDRPYDNVRRQILFDIDAARRAGYTVTVEQSSAMRTGVVTCDGCVYHQGLLRKSYPKQILEVVELPHPDDLMFHVLSGIDSSLTHRTIATFSAQLWQEGDAVRVVVGEHLDATGRIVSVDRQNRSAVITVPGDRGSVEYHYDIFHLQRVHNCGDWVKIFAGPDKGTEGCVVNHIGPNLVLSVHRPCGTVEVRAHYFETFPKLILEKVRVDPILVHSFNGRAVEITTRNQLDTYAHDPEPPQDPIQIGDRAIIRRGPRAGLVGMIMSVSPPHVWVEPLGEISTTDNDEFGPRTLRPIEPMERGNGVEDEDETFEWGDTKLIMVHVENAEIEPPMARLTYSRSSGYDVTLGDLVDVVRGRHWGRTGVVVSVDFRHARMDIYDGEKVSRSFFQYFSDNTMQLNVRISSCTKVSNWKPLSLPRGCDVWVIGGNKKGRLAQLVDLGRELSIISLLENPNFQIKNAHVATR